MRLFKQISAAILALGMVFGASGAMADAGYDGWELAKEKNGVRVFMKQEEGKRFMSYLVDATIPGSPAVVDSVVRNVEGMPDWWGKIKTARQLEQMGENEYLVYMVYNMPFIYSDRDFVQHAKAEFNEDTGEVIVRIANAADKYPEQRRLKRVQESYQIWKMTPVGADKVKIVLQGNTDIGDDIPVGIANDMMPGEQIDMVSGLIEAVAEANEEMASAR